MAQLGSALDLACDAPLDGAILNVSLAGKLCFPIADALSKRGIPFFFVTGYGADFFPAKYRAIPRLPKPFTVAALEDMAINEFSKLREPTTLDSKMPLPKAAASINGNVRGLEDKWRIQLTGELSQALAAMSRQRRLAFPAWEEQRARREGDLVLLRCVRELRHHYAPEATRLKPES